MQHDLVLEGKVVNPAGIEELEVGVNDGKVAEVKKHGLKGERRIRAGRSLIFPGFVDVHVHLREPGWEYKEDFRTGTAAAAHGGVTAVLDMPNNPRPASNVDALREKASLARTKALVEVRFLGGVVPGSLDDVGKIKELVAGYKIFMARSTGSAPFPRDKLEQAFGRISETGLPVSLHCEDQAVIDRMAEKLKGVGRGDVHCDIRPPEAEIASVSMVVEALKMAGDVKANVCHTTTAGALSLIAEAKEGGVDIRCEAALHHLYFNRKAMLANPLLKTNPPLRDEDDRQALLRGLAKGEVSFLVTDHAPHTAEEKTASGLSGVPGLDDYAHMVSWLIKSRGVDPVTVAKVASYNPARYAGLSDRGEVAIGRSGDFSIVDLSSPEIVKPENVMSKCGWSPYEGREFPGKARWTIAKGNVLLDDCELAV